MSENTPKKTYKTKPTLRQRQAAQKIVELRGNVSAAMREVGYSEQTAKNPSNLLDSKGFMGLMDELGLTDDLIVNALVDDIKSKPGNRTQELQLAVKMRGRITEKSQADVKVQQVTPILGGKTKE